MNAEDSAGATFDLQLTCDTYVESVAGEALRILRPRLVEGRGLCAVVERDGEVVEIPIRQLMRQKAFALRAASKDHEMGPEDSKLMWVSTAKREEAYALEQHMIDVLFGRAPGPPDLPTGPYDHTTTSLRQRRKAKRRELDMDNATMGRRLRYYQAQGVWGLVRYRDRALLASGAIGVDEEILAVVRDFHAERVTDSRRTSENEYALVLDRLRRRGLLTLGDDARDRDGRDVPHFEDALPAARFRALMRHLDGGRTAVAAKTRHEQAHRPAVNAYRHQGFDFADRVEMDSTPVNVTVRGDNGPVTAHAVFAVCVSTRYLWVRVTAGAPRGRDLALLLWEMAGGESAFRPDSDLVSGAIAALPRTRLAVNAWRGHGKPPASLPGTVVFDHGAEEENNRLIRYCAQLGITIVWARPRTPTDKARVESKIRQFALACELIPGHKGNTVVNRYATEPTHLPTIEMLQAAVCEWQQYVNNIEHQGLPHPYTPGQFLTPLEAVQNSVTRGIPVRGMTDPTRALGLLEHARLRPQDDGVTFQRRRYVCPGYDDIVHHSLDRNGNRTKVAFYYDPNRPGRLYWPVPGTVDVRVLMIPEEAAVAVMPFADAREPWLAATQGQAIPSTSERGARKADLIGAMDEAMAKAQSVAEVNHIKNPTAPSQTTKPGTRSGKPGSTRGVGATGRGPTIDLPTGGWDLSGVMDVLADPDDHPAGNEDDTSDTEVQW